MKISIITVTYNSSQTIRDTILSVQNQSYNNIEHIIIDGCSTDHTMSIINTLSSKIEIIISEPDFGIYDAMNKGISLATGDIIGILNSDDLFYDDFVIENVMNEFKTDFNLDMLYGNLVYVKQNDTSQIIRKWISKPSYPKFFDNANVPPHPTLFVKNKIYKTVGTFNLKYDLAADYELMLRMFKTYNLKVKYMPITMIRMRLGGATNKNLTNILKGNLEIIRSWKDNGLTIPFYFFPLKLFKRIIQFF